MSTIARVSSLHYHCNACGGDTNAPTHVIHPSYPRGCIACGVCAQRLRGELIDKKRYAPPNCWVPLRDANGEARDTLLVDAYDDGMFIAFVYTPDGKPHFERVRRDDIFPGHEEAIAKWLKEIES